VGAEESTSPFFIAADCLRSRKGMGWLPNGCCRLECFP